METILDKLDSIKLQDEEWMFYFKIAILILFFILLVLATIITMNRISREQERINNNTVDINTVRNVIKKYKYSTEEQLNNKDKEIVRLQKELMNTKNCKHCLYRKDYIYYSFYRCAKCGDDKTMFKFKQ